MGPARQANGRYVNDYDIVDLAKKKGPNFSRHRSGTALPIRKHGGAGAKRGRHD